MTEMHWRGSVTIADLEPQARAVTIADSMREARAGTIVGSHSKQVVWAGTIADWKLAAEATVGMAMYYDAATDLLKCFIRYGSEAWIPVFELTDSSFSNFRYYGIFISGNGAGNVAWATCPLALYAQ